MFKFPLTTKVSMAGPVAPLPSMTLPVTASPTTPMLPQNAPKPQAPVSPAPPPAPGIAANGGGARTGSKLTPRMPAPSATKAFKIGSVKLCNFAPPQDIFPSHHQPRVGVLNAVVDTGKNYLDGLGEYTADVLNENDKNTQRPNDPSVMPHYLGRPIV